MSSHGHFVWTELMTTDLEAASAFYRIVVGWRTQDQPKPDMLYRIVVAGERPVGGIMTLPAEARAMGVPPCWLPYIASRDVDADARRATELGGRLLRPAEDIPDIGRFAVLADPTGAAFNLFTPKADMPAGGPATGAGTVCWNELHADDWQKAWNFYATLFGWERSKSMDMGPMGTYQVFSIDGADWGAMFNSPAAAQARFWLSYVVVGDIDAAVARIAQAGGTLRHGPQEIPGGMWIVQASDPQGAMFALLGSRTVGALDRQSRDEPGGG